MPVFLQLVQQNFIEKLYGYSYDIKRTTSIDKMKAIHTYKVSVDVVMVRFSVAEIVMGGVAVPSD